MLDRSRTVNFKLRHYQRIELEETSLYALYRPSDRIVGTQADESSRDLR